MSSPQYFCTTVIPTIGRDTLARTVESVLSQVCPGPFEVIVVNDSGQPLPPAAWQRARHVQVFNTPRRERSMARNTGAALARGRYLNFLDDDDWLLPGAFNVFWELAQNNPAGWLYGATQLSAADGHCLFQFNHQLSGNCLTPAMAGEWVPLQSSLIAADAFFAVGGFNNTMPGAQDKDLLMRIAHQYDLAGTAAPVTAILRGIWASVTDYNTIPQKWRRSVERQLSQPGTFSRMRASATSAYWHGRWLRVYLLSVAHNARAGRPFTVLSRLLASAGIVLLAGARLLAPAFWRAITRTHLTPGFAPAQRAAQPA